MLVEGDNENFYSEFRVERKRQLILACVGMVRSRKIRPSSGGTVDTVDECTVYTVRYPRRMKSEDRVYLSRTHALHHKRGKIELIFIGLRDITLCSRGCA